MSIMSQVKTVPDWKRKTKAKLYDEIKVKNRRKFGEWGKKNGDEEIKQKPKIKPMNMTVNYKPKTIKIETDEYRKPNYVRKSEK